jgi:hypothetical protein
MSPAIDAHAFDNERRDLAVNPELMNMFLAHVATWCLHAMAWGFQC